MYIDPVLDQGAIDPFLISIAAQTPTNSVGLDDPQANRFPAPNGFS
jgi:hypothetical protein